MATKLCHFSFWNLAARFARYATPSSTRYALCAMRRQICQRHSSHNRHKPKLRANECTHHPLRQLEHRPSGAMCRQIGQRNGSCAASHCARRPCRRSGMRDEPQPAPILAAAQAPALRQAPGTVSSRAAVSSRV